MQIRTVTREEASNWARTSRAMSKDVGEVLDRAGVLLTPERLAGIRANLLNQMAQVLSETPTSQMLGGRTVKNVTITDFQTILADFLRHEANTELERIKK